MSNRNDDDNDNKETNALKATMVVFFVIFLIGFAVGRWSVIVQHSPIRSLSTSGLSVGAHGEVRAIRNVSM